MAKPTKYAVLISVACTILAIIGVAIGLLKGNPLVIIFFLLPTVVYEVYRTEGNSTKTSSVILLLILIGEIIVLLFNVNFNVAEFLDTTEKVVGGYIVPLGDIKIVGPSLMAVLSIILFVKTYGIYTRWLAVVIFIASFAIIYCIDPLIFKDLFKYAVKEGMNNI